jgi:uncharacterized protein (DUF885 family)
VEQASEGRTRKGSRKRRWPRRLAAAGGALLVAAAVFVVPSVWGKPWSIDHYFLRVLVEFAIDHPMLLSYGRVLDPWDLDFYSDELEDFSPEATLRDARKVERFLAGLHRYDGDDLSPEQRLSAEVLEWFLETAKAGEPFLFHSYPVEQFQGWQSGLPDFMVNFHAVEDERDARNYLARLAAFDTALSQLAESVRYRAERGVVPPAFVLRAVREEMAEFTAQPPRENPLYAKLERSLKEIDGLGDAERRDLLDRAAARIEDSVVPGYAHLDRALAALEPQAEARPGPGVWGLPDGEAYYRWALRTHTTTDLGPDEIHQIGLAEVARIRGEMRRVLGEMGIEAEDPVAAIRKLNVDPRFLYPDTDEGRAQVLADYQAILDETLPRLPALFGKLPKAPVVVERVPAFKEAGSAGAYYNPPSLDRSRPGIFYANLRSVREIPRFGMRTLAFHEAIPGHHLQVALAMENGHLPLFRRILPFTAFIEGWALYAERLALEEGFHPTPADRLGAYVAEIFRAVRLVVDTGIHARRWSRERAIDYMLANTGMPRTDVVAEVERYIVAPGQACAYKIGQLQILELRERARERLGDDFDLRAFHDLVLGQGSLPLEILERVVDQWIADQARG